MPTDNFTDGEYEPDSASTTLTDLIDEAESQESFGEDLDPDELSIIRAHYAAIAQLAADMHLDIELVLESARLATATGQSLDYIGDRNGVTRNEANASTGRVRFSRDNYATTTHSIPKGTVVENDSTDPVEFETDRAASVQILDDFEDGNISEYTEDTGDFSVTSAVPQEGTYSLEASATSGSFIFTDNRTFGPGTEFKTRLYLNSNTVGHILFAVKDNSNFYRAVIDASTNAIEIEKVDGGTTSDLKTASVTVPTGEWLNVYIDWQIGGDITLDVDDSSDADVDEITVNDTTITDDELGFGFGSGDANSTKYFDNVRMRTTGVPVTASEAGAGGNLGANALIIMPDPPTGINDVTNPQGTSGGTNKEKDDDYRARIQSEMSDGMRGHQEALVSRIEALDGVTSVTVIENDADSTDAAGRPGHSFEPIVETDSSWFDEVAQTILETKGTGYPSVGGYGGTSQSAQADLSNGQTKTITFSTPAEIKIYVDADLTKTDTYSGDDQVRDNIVRYIGGTLASGDTEDGEIGVSDDVIYNQVLEAVMVTEGVHDVTNLEVDTNATPTGKANISIADTEDSVADATDTSLDISSTDA